MVSSSERERGRLNIRRGRTEGMERGKVSGMPTGKEVMRSSKVPLLKNLRREMRVPVEKKKNGEGFPIFS